MLSVLISATKAANGKVDGSLRLVSEHPTALECATVAHKMQCWIAALPDKVNPGCWEPVRKQLAQLQSKPELVKTTRLRTIQPIEEGDPR